jgi:hypothetical protein
MPSERSRQQSKQALWQYSKKTNYCNLMASKARIGLSRFNAFLPEPAFFGKPFDCPFFVCVDLENFSKFHQIENFFNIGIDIAKSQIDISRLAVLSKQNQFADHGRGHKADILKIQNDLFVFGIICQFRQLLAQSADARFIDDANILKISDQDIFVNSSHECRHQNSLSILGLLDRTRKLEREASLLKVAIFFEKLIVNKSVHL